MFADNNLSCNNLCRLMSYLPSKQCSALAKIGRRTDRSVLSTITVSLFSNYQYFKVPRYQLEILAGHLNIILAKQIHRAVKHLA